jgi:hypothetical protein
LGVDEEIGHRTAKVLRLRISLRRAASPGWKWRWVWERAQLNDRVVLPKEHIRLRLGGDRRSRPGSKPHLVFATMARASSPIDLTDLAEAWPFDPFFQLCLGASILRGHQINSGVSKIASTISASFNFVLRGVLRSGEDVGSRRVLLCFWQGFSALPPLFQCQENKE